MGWGGKQVSRMVSEQANADSAPPHRVELRSRSRENGLSYGFLPILSHNK
jgi:hypothetical protein